MEYLDLSPHNYLGFPLPMRAVVRLGRRYGVQGADAWWRAGELRDGLHAAGATAVGLARHQPPHE